MWPADVSITQQNKRLGKYSDSFDLLKQFYWPQ